MGGDYEIESIDRIERSNDPEHGAAMAARLIAPDVQMATMATADAATTHATCQVG